jgi:nucleotide-binding universal stress UspA family protein
MEADLRSESRPTREVILGKASWLLERQHIPYRSEVVVGKPRELIIAAAEQHHIDLIVMGSRGMQAVAYLFLGSVALWVQRARCRSQS